MANIYDRDGKKVGSKNGEEVYVDDKLVGRIKGNDLVDIDGRPLGQIRGSEVVDIHGNQVFDLKEKSVYDKYSGQEDAQTDEVDDLPAAAFYSLLKKNKPK